MTFHILYFAQLSEALDVKEETLQSSSNTVAELKNELCARGHVWATHIQSATLRCAVNQELAEDTTPIPDNAEVAFFPPVTGG